MKVINRSQVTEIKIERMVTHELKVDGKRYVRHETAKVRVPHMDTETIIGVPVIVWNEYVGARTVSRLSAKQVKELSLEEMFAKLPIDARNGNANAKD